MERNLVTLRKIDSLEPIENADRLLKAKIGGWDVVTEKDFGLSEGDTVLFFEIDSLLLNEVPQFERFQSRGMRKMTLSDGTVVEGHVLRTAKLRGVYSQGLIIPNQDFGMTGFELQEDVDEKFKDIVFKWEPPMKDGSREIAPFPAHISKSRSARIQNLDPEFFASLDPSDWFATEKIDGESATFWKDEEGKLHAASRNWEVKVESFYPEVVEKFKLEDLLVPGEFVQGEVYGPKVNNNRLQRKSVEFSAFAASDLSKFSDISVPILDVSFPSSIEEGVSQVTKMKSTIARKFQAEGVVWWNRNGTQYTELNDLSSFKSINPDYLAKEK